MKRAALAILVALGGAGCGASKPAAPTEAPRPHAAELGERMTPVTKPTAIPVKGAKVTVIDFIWTGCPSSRLWLAFLAKMQKKYAGRGLAVVGVTTLSDETQEDVDAFGKTYGATFPLFADTAGFVKSAVQPLQYQSIVVVDADGVVRATNRGSRDENFERMEAELARLLGP